MCAFSMSHIAFLSPFAPLVQPRAARFLCGSGSRPWGRFAAPSRVSVLAQTDLDSSKGPQSGSSSSVADSVPVWSVGESRLERVVDAVTEAASRAAVPLEQKGVVASVVFVFIRSRHAVEGVGDEMNRVVPVLKKALAMRRAFGENSIVCGCTMGLRPGLDDDTTVTVALAHLPGDAVLRSFRVDDKENVSLDWKQNDWHNFVGVAPSTAGVAGGSQIGSASSSRLEKRMQFLLLQHPDYIGALDVLASLDFAYPQIPKAGAVAGRENPLQNAYIFNNDGAHQSGVLGLVIESSDFFFDVSVAQGARGVGPMVEVIEVKDGTEITKVKEVGTLSQAQGAPMQLLDMWGSVQHISDAEKERARKYLLFGLEVDKAADFAAWATKGAGAAAPENVNKEAEQIDMVVRKVVGFNELTKSLGVEGSTVRVGIRAQFQIRDELAACSELDYLLNRQHLEGSALSSEGMKLIGALLFLDSERGGNLYGKDNADADSEKYKSRFSVPISVVTCDGQIGPLPSGGLIGTAGNSFTLSASALYVSLYGRMSAAGEEAKTLDDGRSTRE